MSLKKLCVLGVICAQSFVSASDESIWESKVLTEIAITTPKKLARFALECSAKMHAAKCLYEKIQKNDENGFIPQKEFVFKTIPTVIADCILKQGKCKPENIHDEFVILSKNEDELSHQDHWDLLILYNYVYGMIYGDLTNCGDSTLIGDNFFESIGDKAKKQYGYKYDEEIGLAVTNVDNYDHYLNLNHFLLSIEFSEDAKELSYSTIEKLPYIKKLNLTSNCPYFECDEGLVYKPRAQSEKNPLPYERLPIKFCFCADSIFTQPCGCMTFTQETNGDPIMIIETFTANEYLEHTSITKWKQQLDKSRLTQEMDTIVSDSMKNKRPPIIKTNTIKYLCLTPELYKLTPLIQTRWEDTSKPDDVYKLKDIKLNKTIIKYWFFPLDSDLEIRLQIPKTLYRGHTLIIDEALRQEIESRQQYSHRPFCMSCDNGSESEIRIKISKEDVGLLFYNYDWNLDKDWTKYF